MTKKEYEKAAALIQKRAPKSKKVRTEMVQTFVEFFRNDNPRFDEERFIFACQREVK
jgi:hypothetical protein